MTRHGEMVDGRGTYQVRKFREAMRWVRPLGVYRMRSGLAGRVAIDVGAHVGFWTIRMAERFETVHCFEPVPAFAECWQRNVQAKNALLYSCVLGAQSGMGHMVIDPADSGGTHLGAAGPTVRVIPLDMYDLADVDFIKIDCEGYELEVLKGSVETLKRSRPCVIVEQKPHKLGPNFGIKGTPAVDFLRSLGAVQRVDLGGDYVLSWDA